MQWTAADQQAENAAWITTKEFYLQTMLEALAQVEWTGAKRRRELVPAMMPYRKNMDFAYAYVLPTDCAKAIELDGQAYFEVEFSLLYTDDAPARLLYVSNGWRLIDQTSLRAGNARRPLMANYFTGGDCRRNCRYEWGDNSIFGGSAARAIRYPPEAAEDFPDYREPRLEPHFYLYWENLLSAKYALRLTDKPDLSLVFFNKAQAIGRAAEVISITHSAGRRAAPPTWQETLGLS